MSAVTRKTEIEPLDGTPEKRMFWSIISDYDIKTGITELIDNGVDLWARAGRNTILNIAIDIDSDRQIIKITDNAGGVRREDLRLLIVPGGSNNAPEAESIGIFGVGSKRAVVALSENAVIKTRYATGNTYQVDIGKEWLESDDWELAAYQVPDISPSTTHIELSQLRSVLTSDHVILLLTHFGETYDWYLREGNLEITVNGKSVVPIRFDSWAYPPDFPPENVEFDSHFDTGFIRINITAGLITDRDPIKENYGVYFYCNNRLIVKELRVREVGYYIGSEAGVPHPDSSLCRVIVRLGGPARLMPWNSSKTGINYSHLVFTHLRSTLTQLVRQFSSLSRRLKDDWDNTVYAYTQGSIKKIPPEIAERSGKLVLPALPRVNKTRPEKLKAKNKLQIEDQPWTLGLVEAVAAVDVLNKQKFETRNRISLILLDSNFEIALKEFIVHRSDLFNPKVYNDAKIQSLFNNRRAVINEITGKVPIKKQLLDRVNHYYSLRNKLIHERATVGILDSDVENYRKAIEQILNKLFNLTF